jgi:hypothetical protein
MKWKTREWIRRTHGGAVNSDELMPSRFRKLLTRVNSNWREKAIDW